MPIAWTIAASDSSAGAGIQADLATFAHFKVHGCSVISKITAQNTQGIIAAYTLPDEIFSQQIQALATDLAAKAIKISVLDTAEQIKCLIEFLADYPGYTVYDPVFFSSNNSMLTDTSLIQIICRELLPRISLITPNIQEAEALTNIRINSYPDIIQAGKLLLECGVKNVLIKGGHFDSIYASDFFINTEQSFWLISKKETLDYPIHGTGCHLSSAIVANLALGLELQDALVIAKRYMNSAIRVCAVPVTGGWQHYIPNYHFDFKSVDTPVIVKDYLSINQLAEPDCRECGPIGLYPVVDSSQMILALAKSGITTIQLRIKDTTDVDIEREVIKSIQIAKANKIRLFINDYWKLAIKYKVYGVHLGQDDLVTADIPQIKAAGIRLGISTHSHYELAIALAYKPSYIALGPVFPTSSKIMPWRPQGIERLKEWQTMLDCELIVIGGIDLTNIEEIVKIGIKNIALISAITKADNPYIVTQALLVKINGHE